ncbi:hypothetical protein SLS63_006678 [Diaporthe eres]|uniref:Uncharacterized protein n=1 Tax=Diaporthe eres TaxID=83184 RepID=A0ABR1P7Q9_DIAER
MDDDRERQQRDLRRATVLLKRMERQELVDMLHDILFNERSDDTRKLSDWMAFQIIIQDETHDARKLLAQLGKPTDKTSDETTPAEASGSSGSFSEAKGTPSGDKKSLEEMDLPSSAPGARDRDHGRDNRASGKQRWYVSIFGQRYQNSSEPSSSKEDCHQPAHLLNPAASSFQAATRQDDPPPTIHPQATENIRKAALKATTLQTTNELGHKNMADLYARFDTDYVKSLKADLLSIDAGKTGTLDLALSVTSSAFEDMKKMQCQFCKLYFTAEQNLRELDNGLSPCSYHPGKQFGSLASS